MPITNTPGGSEIQTERVLVSRQPIYRGDMTVFGYELLFRDGDSSVASFPDGSGATAQVIVNTFMDIGLDEMVGRHLAFINFERQLLMDNYCESLPPERVVLEVLETVEADPAIMKRLERLRAKGYRIALDDFVCSEPYTPLLEFADFVKFDLLATEWSAIDRALSTVTKYPIELLAEKVESRAVVKWCEELGFRYFQGYFFCRPQNISQKRLPPNRMTTIRLLTDLNKPDIKVQELEGTISQDLALSYKLLRYINSPMFRIDRHVESIRHATVMVGLEKMRVWASLIALSGFKDTSREVIVTGAIRARMCELLAVALRLPHTEQHFLVGLLSVLDAILDRPMEQVVSLLSLSDEINEALLKQEGELGAVLRCVRAYEQREWSEAQAAIPVVQEVIVRTYLEALAWSSSVLGLS
jgi:EAL and modified HD-GYP domain-containing signal transduction protein